MPLRFACTTSHFITVCESEIGFQLNMLYLLPSLFTGTLTEAKCLLFHHALLMLISGLHLNICFVLTVPDFIVSIVGMLVKFMVLELVWFLVAFCEI